MSDVLEQDQEDFFSRLKVDPFFSDISVLLQRKGVTESDVNDALSVLNEKVGKIGAVATIIMPSLLTDTSEGPAARYKVRVTVQVIEQPLFNLSDSGTGKSAEQIATRVRQLLQNFSAGRSNTFGFDGMEPLAVDAGKISYGVSFVRLGGDEVYSKVATPAIAPRSGASPLDVTIACATPGASIYYTTDGTYPSSLNGTLYVGPLAIAAATILRAAAEKTGLQQSDVAQGIFT